MHDGGAGPMTLPPALNVAGHQRTGAPFARSDKQKGMTNPGRNVLVGWLIAKAKADVKCIDGGPCLRFASLYPLTREGTVASFTRSGFNSEVPLKSIRKAFEFDHSDRQGHLHYSNRFHCEPGYGSGSALVFVDDSFSRFR
jgi:hypothetical protein